VEDSTPSVDPIKLGVITDQTGPLSFMGIANANVAKMVIDDINASGGLLGRRVDLYLEDSAPRRTAWRRRKPPSSSSAITST
jgi:ABC-type branched-subunit amino acid transport system substrate-binding protein